MSFLAELRRRNVIRMAGLYLVGAWRVVPAILLYFADMHDDPRWLPFLRKIGLGPEQRAAIKLDVPLPQKLQ